MGVLYGQQLDEWVEQYTNRLVRLAYTYERCWQTAEDRVQDAFVKAYKQQHQLRNQVDAFPWLARIVINECKMSWRRSWREVVMEWLPDNRQLVSAEDELMGKLESAEIYQHVLELPEPFRTAIILFYFEDLSVDEISSILDVSQGTVKSRLARGRDRLYRVMREEGVHGRQVEKCKTTV
ncbi:sigma-70 family RNA polymerase sigma factor [Brevibacillus ruminantium]|uniref:Sigma-70 family RNA polymerase sigma factor n=1 Tax=Brevibacillus ruminantium TaxID=2950604 RepID=A0ABY4WDD0_9BACL|nr:sigma-70 family RNA polymerase sigma factor [Brevibacillus ruminantium]USG63775.1 sigma-70 family RNA polymerase sigma factor [Brevibacillus ruminantium]